jgi:hypothetical protein
LALHASTTEASACCSNRERQQNHRIRQLRMAFLILDVAFPSSSRSAEAWGFVVVVV